MPHWHLSNWCMSHFHSVVMIKTNICHIYLLSSWLKLIYATLTRCHKTDISHRHGIFMIKTDICHIYMASSWTKLICHIDMKLWSISSHLTQMALRRHHVPRSRCYVVWKLRCHNEVILRSDDPWNIMVSHRWHGQTDLFIALPQYNPRRLNDSILRESRCGLMWDTTRSHCLAPRV